MRIYCLLSLILLCFTTANAQLKTIAHYNMGNIGNVTYAATGDALKDISGNNHDLKKFGGPVFFADAPADKKMKGEGAVLFKSPGSYRISQTLSSPSDPFLLEVWVKPSHVQKLEGDHYYPVVAHGSQEGGYMIAQQGQSWTAVVDGETVYTLAPVVDGQWIHLALATEGNKTRAYVNGKKGGTFKKASQVASNFSIGQLEKEPNAFNGMVYEVRLSQLGGERTDVTNSLLINPVVFSQATKQVQADQKALIEKIVKADTRRTGEISTAGIQEDWLLHHIKQPSQLKVEKGLDGLTAKLLLTNGLISRTFYVADNAVSVSLKNLSNDAEYIRAVKPEVRVQLDSTWYEVGGLGGQPEKSYLLESWYKDLVADPKAFKLSDIEVKEPEARYTWQQKYNAAHAEWPPKGLHIIMHYSAPLQQESDVTGVSVEVHYEIYDGIPVISKWVKVNNEGTSPVVVSQIETEVLAIAQDQIDRIHVESDYSFALVNADLEGSALMHFNAEPKPYVVGQSTTKWKIDNDYNTWASHNQAEDNFLGFPHHNLLVSHLPMGPSERVDPDGTFTSFVTFELLHDSDDKERKSLAHRRFYRTLAPQVTESLLRGGITSQDPEQIKSFVDQLHELGFEGLDIMAWPGISHDNIDTEYLNKWTDVASYAKERGMTMGGYELQIASRGRGADVDVINPETGKPGGVFGQSVCIASSWRDTYYSKMWTFFDKTGFLSFNMDGPYHGDACASEEHAYHRGLEDSQWEQWKTQVNIIHELQRRNASVPIPDWYFLNGQSATGMGYREATANLTPQQQLLLGRQYIYDGTWHKAPTMGWMTLQLVGFYSNDPSVGLEPLADNIDRYETQLFQYLASGCQLTVRGNRIYDTPETKAMVQKWITWFKRYRTILTSDIIHLGRPTGRDLDALFHVNPFNKEKGMVVVFNPTDKAIKKSFRIPLYYTGLTGNASIREQEGASKPYDLDLDHAVHVPVDIPAGGFTWLVVE